MDPLPSADLHPRFVRLPTTPERGGHAAGAAAHGLRRQTGPVPPAADRFGRTARQGAQKPSAFAPATVPAPARPADAAQRWQQRAIATAGNVAALATTFGTTAALVARFAAPMTGLGAGLIAGTHVLSAVVYFCSKQFGMPRALGAYAMAATFGALVGETTRTYGALACGVGAYTVGISLALGSLGALLPVHVVKQMRGPIQAGIAAVCISALVALVVPASWSVAVAAHSVELYGGLVLFAASMVQQTGEAVHEAEHAPNYDPLHHAMGIYLSMLNVFLRLLEIAARHRDRRP